MHFLAANKIPRSRHFPQTIRMAIPVLLLLALIVIGCGSSSRTTPADVNTIVVAEHRFLARYGRARKLGEEECSGKTGAAYKRCYDTTIVPRQEKVAGEFLKSIEALLDAGVGPKCAKALEETESAIYFVPEFPGEATMACRSESRQ